MKKNILLISFYNPKSLGLRYLENALVQNGYDVTVAYFKSFNSVNPKRATDNEYTMLCTLIKEKKPIAIGLSVMASYYLDTVMELNKRIKGQFKIPIVWGGVYATMFPEKSMEYADFIIRGEGEAPFVELAGAISTGSGDFSGIKNLTYRTNGQIVSNDLRDLMTDLDMYGIPDIGGKNKYFIENGAMINEDPQLSAYSYELSASRGCPFACTYCCSINLHRISAKKGRYVRFRKVDKVIEELINAKTKMKKLKVVHFWDEIFSDEDDWIDNFVTRYKKEIDLPFEIWGHPLKTNDKLISKLKKAGLYKVVMGIQSGSPHIRKDIFNRPEKQDEIFKAAKILVKHKIPQVAYDFMLRHPFETHDTIRETYEMCIKLPGTFELQMHGLNFLPGTDIVEKAITMGLVSPEKMERLMHAPLEEQYSMHWKNDNSDEVLNYWYKLIYLTQFPSLKKKTILLAKDPNSVENRKKVDDLCKRGKMLEKLRYYYNKGIIVIKGTI